MRKELPFFPWFNSEMSLSCSKWSIMGKMNYPLILMKDKAWIMQGTDDLQEVNI